MAPPGGSKRKRGDRTYSYDSNDDRGVRPSPYSPDRTRLGQQSEGNLQENRNQHDSRQFPRGGRRGRGGRGGNHQGAGNPRLQSQNSTADQPAPSPTAGTMSPAPSQPVQTIKSPPQQSMATQTPPPPAPTPSATNQADAPTTPDLTSYRFLNEERVAKWEAEGRAELITQATDAVFARDNGTLNSIYQEIIWAGLSGKLDADDAGRVVAEIIAASVIEDEPDYSATLFLDTLSMDGELEPNILANPRLRNIMTSTEISPTLMREILEENVLVALGLVRQTFGRVFIRQQTNVLYRQSNYNLLREETEGYSKLLTLLFTTASNSPPSGPVVSETFENIKALIGSFDLDAGRVLDVILDAFASLLVKHYRFFVKLLRTTSFWPQKQVVDGLDIEGQDFTSLPHWAHPGYAKWYADQEEKERLLEEKRQRDEYFWERARQVGMDAFFELGGRRVLSDQEYVDRVCDALQSTDTRTVEDYKWIKLTRTMPPPGNSIAAQLLGFKLRFYASGARDPSDTLPVNLIYLAALLIKIGFISLRDLYPHLFPDDEALASVKEKQLKEKEEREMAKRPGGGATNALTRAGALKDDTLPAPGVRKPETRAATPSKSDPASSSKADTPSVPVDETEKEPKEPLPEPTDQKIQLLKSLLCIGAIPEALYTLGRFPWLLDAFTELPEHIHRIAHHALKDIYADLVPLKGRQHGINQPKKAFFVSEPPRKVLRWAQMESADNVKDDQNNEATEHIDYRFYWDDWTDNVPVCQTVDDVFALCDTLLNITGVKIGQDAGLLTKLTRIGKHSLTEDPSPQNRQRWLTLCKRLLVPALSLAGANTGVINEVFGLLKFFPTTTRYSVYAEWYTGPTSRLPDIKNAFATTTARTKDKLKRMSKENMRQMARDLAKLSYSSPGISFQLLVNQLQSYENFIDVIVDCARYFTHMGYDVLTWCIINTMSQVGKSRLSADGITTSKWLKSMSEFIGKIYKRYSSMGAFPILQYVLYQVQHNNFIDLSILGDLVTEMAGITKDQDPSDAQLQAMAGGPLLQAQALRQIHDRRHESKASARRLIRTLVDNNIAFPLLVAIAQQRQICYLDESQIAVKAMAENFDFVNLIFAQYLDMLRHNVPIKDFEAMAPGVVSLISDYGVEAGVAFTIHRKGVARAIEEYDVAHPPEKKSMQRTQSIEKVSADVDVEMADATESKAEAAVNGIHTEAEAVVKSEENKDESKPDEINPGEDEKKDSKPDIVDVEMAEPSATENGASSPEPATIVQKQPWHPVLRELMDEIRPALPEEFENSMSVSFFVTFWQLSLHDILAPSSSYSDELSKQQSILNEINKKRTDGTAAGARKKEQEKKNVTEFMEKVTEEMKAHINSYGHIRSRLDKEKSYWFKDFAGAEKGRLLNMALLEQCFIPRLLLSPVDSLFTSKMLLLLHSSGATNFRTMHVIDRIIGNKNMIANLIYHCSVREAENLGRFLNELLKEFSSWHAQRSVYEKKAYGVKHDLPGFAKKFSMDGKPTEFLPFEDFRRLLLKWHQHLFKALKDGLDGGEYVHVKNALIIIRFVAKYFPAIDWMGDKLMAAVQYHIDIEYKKTADKRRQDIFTTASSVMPSLQRRKQSWVLHQAFSLSDGALRGQASPNPAAPTASKSPQPSQPEQKSLNAEAPAFAPSSTNESSSDRKISISGKNDPEDGEVEDSEMADTKAEVSAEAKEDLSANKTDTEVPPVNDRLAAVRNEDAAARTSRPNSRVASPARSPAPANNSNDNSETGEKAATEDKANSDANSTLKSGDSTARPPLSREASSSTTPQRAAHKLPDRPDVQSQGRRNPERGADRSGRQLPDKPDSRPRSRADQRSERSDLMQEKLDERQSAPSSRMDDISGTSRPQSSSERPRDGVKPQEREPPRSQPTSPRDPAERDNRTGALNTSSSSQPQRASSRPQTPLKPADARYHSEHSGRPPGPPLSSHPTDRGPPMGGSRPSHAPPDEHYSRGPPPHYGPEDPRDRYARPYPPDREEWHEGAYRRDGRPDMHGRPSSYEYDSRRGYGDYPVEPAPSGPRLGRPSRGGTFDNQQGYRDPMQPPASRPSQMGQGAARAFHEHPRPIRQHDVNYGRLNADANPPPSPSGPRSNRNYAGQVSQDRRESQATQSNHDAPASVPQDSAPRIRESRPDKPEATSTSAPPTPSGRASNTEPAVVHPDRLNQIQGSSNPGPMQAGSSSSGSGMAPSEPRMGNSRGPNTPVAAGSGRPPPTGPSGGPDRPRDDRRMYNAQNPSQNNVPARYGSGQNLSERDEDRGASIRGRAAAEAAKAGRDPPQDHTSAEQSRTDMKGPINSVEREREEHNRAREQAYRGSRPQTRNTPGDRPMETSHNDRQPRSRTERHERSRSPQREREDGRSMRERTDASHLHRLSREGDRNGREREHRLAPREDLMDPHHRHDQRPARPGGPEINAPPPPQPWNGARGSARAGPRQDREIRERREHGGSSRHSDGRKRAWEGDEEGGRDRMESSQHSKRPRKSGP